AVLDACEQIVARMEHVASKHNFNTFSEKNQKEKCCPKSTICRYKERLEELKWGDAAHTWSKPGALLTCGPGNYKIPSINDILFQLNVSLFKGNYIHLKQWVSHRSFLQHRDKGSSHKRGRSHQLVFQSIWSKSYM
ncbi:unnamed protein product, partial [Arabidopsis halleri]